MLSNYESVFRKAGIAEADCAFNMWSEDRFPATAPTLADFLNWMPSTATQLGKMLEMPRNFKNPLKLPSPPPHKGSSWLASPLSLVYYA